MLKKKLNGNFFLADRRHSRLVAPPGHGRTCMDQLGGLDDMTNLLSLLKYITKTNKLVKERK